MSAKQQSLYNRIGDIIESVSNAAAPVIEWCAPNLKTDQTRVRACSKAARAPLAGKKDHTLYNVAGQTYRRTSDGESVRVTANGRLTALTQKDREEVYAAGLDEDRAAELKPYWASGASAQNAALQFLDPVTSTTKTGYSPRTLDKYWAAFNAAEKTAKRVGETPSPIERDHW